MTGSPTRPLRILLAGAGAFGREHLERLMARTDVEVAGVADPSAAAREHLAAHHPQLLLFADPLTALEQLQPDGTIVAASAAAHFSVASHALALGIPVLLEKPVTPTVAEAERLAAMSAKAFVLPGHVLRFSRDHRALAEIAQSGTIGDIIYVNSRRYRDDDHAVRFANEDPVLTTLVHDIDLAIWLARGPFKSVRGCRSPGVGFRSFTSADLETGAGVRCHLRTCWTFPGGELPPDRLEVVGSRGSVELDVAAGLTLYAAGKRRELPLSQGDDQLANEHDHFLALIRNGRQSDVVTMADAVHGLGIANAILQSLRDNRVVPRQRAMNEGFDDL